MQCNAKFPLPLREKGERLAAILRRVERVRMVAGRERVLPLPTGEGRGEGTSDSRLQTDGFTTTSHLQRPETSNSTVP